MTRQDREREREMTTGLISRHNGCGEEVESPHHQDHQWCLAWYWLCYWLWESVTGLFIGRLMFGLACGIQHTAVASYIRCKWLHTLTSDMSHEKEVPNIELHII